jgi:hypothetical protein
MPSPLEAITARFGATPCLDGQGGDDFGCGRATEPVEAAGGRAAVRGPTAAAPPGLVVSSTSTKLILVSDENARIRRLSRAVKVTAHHVDAALREGGFRFRCAFVTATYARDDDWSPRDITRLVDRYQQWGKSRGFKVPCVWVAELMQNGRVHYHLMLWIPQGETPPLPDSQGWWVKGLTNAQWSHSPVGYLAKYASKGSSSGEFPKGLRMYGVAGLTMAMRRRTRYALAPTWLKELVPVSHGVERVVRRWYPMGRFATNAERAAGGRWLKCRGWWRDLKTRVCFRTPWVGEFVPGQGIELSWRGVLQDMFAER